MTRLITSIQEPQELFDTLIRAAADLTGADRGFLLLTSNSTAEACEALQPVAAYRIPPALLGEADFSPSRSAITEALQTGKTVVRQTAGSGLAPSQSMLYIGVSAVLVEPIVLQGRVKGVLYLDTQSSGTFRKNHIQMLPSFAAQAAICLDGLRLRTERETALRKQHAEEIRARELQIYKETTDAFMRMASQDLRAPLAVLRTGLACLKRNPDPTQKKVLFQDLEDALARSERVVSDCLERNMRFDHGAAVQKNALSAEAHEDGSREDHGSI